MKLKQGVRNRYFKQQNATPPNNILDPETNMETHSNERVERPLDYPITNMTIQYEEFEAAVNKLKASSPVLCYVTPVLQFSAMSPRSAAEQTFKF